MTGVPDGRSRADHQPPRATDAPEASSSRSYPYAFHIALDGNGINGLEGYAGVCAFLYDPEDGSYAYKVKYFDGVAAGHAVSVNPGGTIGFLGNAGQHLVFYDALSLEEVARISTLRFEVSETSIQGSTHLVWLGDREFITAIGDFFYLFDLDHLEQGRKLGPHGVKLPHAMKLSASRRRIFYGSMDHPTRGEAREVGIWDLESARATRVELPATCWHLAADPRRDLFYPVTFRVLPQEYRDYHQWAIAFFKEYAFEVDGESGRVTRHWAASREIPAHINSDVTLSDTELIFCNGASQTIVCVDLASMASFRVIDERPDVATLLSSSRQVATQVYDSLARGGLFTSTRDFFAAVRVSRFTLLDSVHGCQLSRDQRLLFTANRGLNHITIYDYPAATVRLRVRLPDIQEYLPSIPPLADPRLGFHHGTLRSPMPG